jgi:hypothetical protein
MSRTTCVFRVSAVSPRLADLLFCSLGVVSVAARLPRLTAFGLQIGLQIQPLTCWFWVWATCGC